MKTEISYKNLSKDKADNKAIADLKAYLSAGQWDTMMQMVGAVNAKAEGFNFQTINVGLGFTGVTGYPVFAFGRKYTPDAYRAWLEEDGIKVDSEGFPIYEKQEV